MEASLPFWAHTLRFSWLPPLIRDTQAPPAAATMAAGCRANLDLEAEKLNCEIAELENSVKHLVRKGKAFACLGCSLWPHRVGVYAMRRQTALRCRCLLLYDGFERQPTSQSSPPPPKKRRSNEELAAALKDAPRDGDFAAALQENEGVIARKEALLAELRTELQGLKASLVRAVGAGNAAAAAAVVAAMEPSGPVPVPVTDATGEQQPQRGQQELAVAAAPASSSGPQLPEGEEEGGGIYL